MISKLNFLIKRINLLVTIILVLVASENSLAQDAFITGPNVVYKGDRVVYSLTNLDEIEEYGARDIIYFSWDSYYGGWLKKVTIYGSGNPVFTDLAQDTDYYEWWEGDGVPILDIDKVGVEWYDSSSSSHYVYYAADNGWDFYYGEEYVVVNNLQTPNNPTISNVGCGQSTLSISGSPLSGTKWYWQGKDSNGTSTTKGYGSTFTADEGSGNYYIRARSDNGGWSSSSGSVYVSIQSESTWYQDQDSDGLGDPNSTLLACSQPSGYVANSDDLCPWSESDDCLEGCYNQDINQIVSTVYDLGGNVKGSSKLFYNGLGKLMQSQSLDVKTDNVWATQVLYDSHGRPALQSLSAPISDTNCMLYDPGFMRNASGATYSISDFESNEENPSAVGTSENTVGWYYSTLNTNSRQSGNSYQDVTSYPFTRTIYSKLNPGAVKKVIGGNKVNISGSDQWAQSYSFTMPVAQELHYAFGIDQIPLVNIEGKTSCPYPTNSAMDDYSYDIIEVDINNGCTYIGQILSGVVIEGGNYDLQPNEIYQLDYYDYNTSTSESEKYYVILNKTNGIDWNNYSKEAYIYCGPYSSCTDIQLKAAYIKASKTVVRDVHGVETVVFTDSDGNTLAAARSGNEDDATRKKYKVLSPIGEQGFVDIHIPVGCGGTLTFKGANGSIFNIYDLVTETKLNTSPIAKSAGYSVNPGFYRVEEATFVPYHKNPDSYVKINGSDLELLDSTKNIGVEYYVNYYDYSLNFFDKAGRLTKTIQPRGFDTTLNLTTLTRSHTLVSTYSYNSLGQLLSTTSPDEGTANFLYRKDGQIRYSQNSKQAASSPKELSYTNYDRYGRPEESGIIESNIVFNSTNLDADASSLTAGVKKERHVTLYDILDTSEMHSALSASGISTSNYPVQKFVAGNVSKTYNTDASNQKVSTTWYSYDVFGRVEWLVQKIEGLGTTTLDYTYDPVTGAVTKVDYQKYKSTERFIHRYTYNIANELVKVETSTIDSSYTLQAEYDYYETGALKRTELAGNLQGIDYVYNLNGQLKAINSPQGSGFKDPGNDGLGTTGFIPDVFGMLIDYHNKDYSRTGTAYNGLKNTSTNNQFNGNIGSIRWHNKTTAPGSSNIDTYKYQYNKNNRLKQADYGVSNASSSVSYTQNSNNDYQVSNLTYDANGNIKTLKRNKHYQSGNAMDNLTYNYDATKKNQLKRIVDAAGDAANADDIYTQSDANNYMYNTIGQLTENKQEGLKYYYNASGLVTEIQKNNLPLVKFGYNDKGHRVKKLIYNGTGSLIRTDYYVRDASGSLLALYEGSTLKEYPVYGASRLGVYYKGGATAYQIADHLGNVRAVVVKNGSTALSVTSKTDYYPFGMPMPNRNVEGNYRYGYQGEFAEKEPELPGRNSFELRLWDSRIGRWLTTDPYGQYASPYLGMGNDPINGIDPDGGYKTKWGRFWGWVGGGFKGSFYSDKNNANPHKRYGIISGSSSSEGVVYNISFGDWKSAAASDLQHQWHVDNFEQQNGWTPYTTYDSRARAIAGLAEFAFPSAKLASAPKLPEVLGTAQSTGTRGHAFVSKAIGLRYSLDPRVSRVTYDLGYKRLLGGGAFKYGPRPDVGVLFKNGSVKIFEVSSKTDIFNVLLQRNNLFMMNNGIKGSTTVNNTAKYMNYLWPK